MTAKEIRERLELAEIMGNNPAVAFGRALLDWRRRWASTIQADCVLLHGGRIESCAQDRAECAEARAILAEEKKP